MLVSNSASDHAAADDDDADDSDDVGWGNSLLAFVALAMCPIPWVFYHYGERIRTHPKWQVQF